MFLRAHCDSKVVLMQNREVDRVRAWDMVRSTLNALLNLVAVRAPERRIMRAVKLSCTGRSTPRHKPHSTSIYLLPCKFLIFRHLPKYRKFKMYPITSTQVHICLQAAPCMLFSNFQESKCGLYHVKYGMSFPLI